MATPADDGIKGGDGEFPSLPSMDDVPAQQQILIASILVACMLVGAILFGFALHMLRRRGYFTTDENSGRESVFISSRFVGAVGGRFMSLTERRRREDALSKNKPPVINLPIKSLQETEPVAWDKLQPVCAQFEEADEEDSSYEDARRPSASSYLEAYSPSYAPVLVGAIIMMPTITPKRTHGQPPVVHLEMMLGTSRV